MSRSGPKTRTLCKGVLFLVSHKTSMRMSVLSIQPCGHAIVEFVKTPRLDANLGGTVPKCSVARRTPREFEKPSDECPNCIFCKDNGSFVGEFNGLLNRGSVLNRVEF
jgi:hypothetical protein